MRGSSPRTPENFSNFAWAKHTNDSLCVGQAHEWLK